MTSERRSQSEGGQSVVIFALTVVALFLGVAMAIDGGNILNGRRVAQNGADSAALRGIHYINGSDAPSESRLQEVINSVVESNGIPDTDDIPGNNVNGNITIYYTDADGERLTSQPCYKVPCGSIPSITEGIDVDVANLVDTYFLGLISRPSVRVGAHAVAVVRGGTDVLPDLQDNALIAFGDTCTEDDIPLDMSFHYGDVIGGIRSQTWFENRGTENHYHGQVYYGDGYGWIDTADIPGVYEPQEPISSTVDFQDPFEGLFTVEDFNCTDGSIGSADANCYDVESLAPSYSNEVNYQLLTQNSPDGGAPYLDEVTGELREGIYYAGQYPIRFGWEPISTTLGLHGVVTLVTSSTIKITEDDVQLTGYLASTSAAPGLLMYSGKVSADPCANFESDPLSVPINTTGNQGTVLPKVYHVGDDPQGNYVSHELGSLFYKGLIYAPGGRVAVSGHGASYEGAIVAYSIRVNGYFEFENEGALAPLCEADDDPCRDIYYPEVSALFVFDSDLFPVTLKRIYLSD
jgi:hypothetical protein